MNAFLANTSGAFSRYSDQLNGTLAGLTHVTQQLRDNAAGVTETVDVVPLLMQNLDKSVSRDGRYFRSHVLLGASLTGEMVSLFCERIQMNPMDVTPARPKTLDPISGSRQRFWD